MFVLGPFNVYVNKNLPFSMTPNVTNFFAALIILFLAMHSLFFFVIFKP